VTKNSSVTVGVIRRTELAISCTRRTAGDTVVIASPGPPDRVPHKDVEGVRHETYLIACGSYRHIENLAASQPLAAWHLTPLLVDNPDNWNDALFRCGTRAAVVIGLGCREECHYSQHRQPTTRLRASL